MGDIRFTGYEPGSLADVVKLHATYYAREWNFGMAFETKVASEMAAFLSRYDVRTDLFLCAYDAEIMLGSITIVGEDGQTEGAHLRWFVVNDAARGKGIGRALMSRAMNFCRERAMNRVYLTTFAGLEAASHLYTAFGFHLQREEDKDQWQGGVREQRFECDLSLSQEAI